MKFPGSCKIAVKKSLILIKALLIPIYGDIREVNPYI
jgi:hypothetical protein